MRRRISVEIPDLTDLVWTGVSGFTAGVAREITTSLCGLRLHVRMLTGDVAFDEPETYCIWWIESARDPLLFAVAKTPRSTQADTIEAAMVAVHAAGARLIESVLCDISVPS